MNSETVTIFTQNAAVIKTISLPTKMIKKTTVKLINADINLSRLLPVPAFSLAYDRVRLDFPPSNFVSGKELASFFELHVPDSVMTSVSYDEYTHKLTLNIANGHRIFCDAVLMAISGLPAFCQNVSSGVVNVSYYLNYVYLMCDIVDMQFYNNQRLPILGVFPVRPGDDTVSVHYGQCFPVNLTTSEVARFNVWFLNENLQPLTFADGNTTGMLQLEFE